MSQTRGREVLSNTTTHSQTRDREVLSNTTTHSQTRGREVPSDKISILPAWDIHKDLR